jgi:hypothetical protein
VWWLCQSCPGRDILSLGEARDKLSRYEMSRSVDQGIRRVLAGLSHSACCILMFARRVAVCLISTSCMMQQRPIDTRHTHVECCKVSIHIHILGSECANHGRPFADDSVAQPHFVLISHLSFGGFWCRASRDQCPLCPFSILQPLVHS